MKKSKTSIIRKIIGLILILLLLFGVGVLAVNTQYENVKIEFQNGYELDALTTKTKVSEILADNKIIIEDNQKVIPGLDEDITPGQKIKIVDKSVQEIKIATISQEGVQTSIDELLENYSPITEKIVKEEQVIPFETITKTTTDETEDVIEKVLQEGQNGLKELTYKIKYQNGQEIEKILLEEIIHEPVDKIVQVSKKSTITSRSSNSSRTSNTGSTTAVVGGETYKITAYCSCAKCCGKSNGMTACGTHATAGVTVAAPARFAFGTQLNINGHIYTVEDRGGAINGNKIDIYVDSHEEALQWGVKYLPVSVAE